MRVFLWGVGLALSAASAFSQAPAYRYDVVVIRPNVTGSCSSHVSMHPGSLMATNVALKDLLVSAFGLQTAEQLIGLPGWVNGVHYDITAKVDAETAAKLQAMDHKQSHTTGEEAEQILLAERFGLKAHLEKRELPEYALVQAKGGSKLLPGDELGPKAGGVHTSSHTLKAEAVRLEELTAFLAEQTHRPVVDQTGLTGKFDLALVWTPDGAPVPATELATPGLFTAVQEQMGLKLESIKGPADVLVVDAIAPPTEN